jgi:hypothetical protein
VETQFPNEQRVRQGGILLLVQPIGTCRLGPKHQVVVRTLATATAKIIVPLLVQAKRHVDVPFL